MGYLAKQSYGLIKRVFSLGLLGSLLLPPFYIRTAITRHCSGRTHLTNVIIFLKYSRENVCV